MVKMEHSLRHYTEASLYNKICQTLDCSEEKRVLKCGTIKIIINQCIHSNLELAITNKHLANDLN